MVCTLREDPNSEVHVSIYFVLRVERRAMAVGKAIVVGIDPTVYPLL
jgi:hypothetical protein